MKKLIMIMLLMLSMLTTTPAVAGPVEPVVNTELLIRKPSSVETEIVSNSLAKKLYGGEDYGTLEFRVGDDKIYFHAYYKCELNEKTYLLGRSNVPYVNVVCVEKDKITVVTDYNRVIEITNIMYSNGTWEVIRNIPNDNEA